MEKMKDLRDLLHHEVMDLASAEEQIIAALPKMIEKAGDPALKTALREHLKITEEQKKRLDKVHGLLHGGKAPEGEDKGGLFGRLFGSGGQKCKGTQGLIEEGEKIMGEDMNPEVMDAAIIASAQKIEHYEICGYGTAKAFALELGLTEVARLLDQTLNEEYEADDMLTAMAVGRLNKEAEMAAGAANSGRGGQNNNRGRNAKGTSKAGSAAAKASKAASKKGSAPAKKNATKGGSKGASKQSSSNSGRSNGSSASKSGSTKARSKKAAGRGR